MLRLPNRFFASHNHALGSSSRPALRWLRYHAWVGKQHTMLFAVRPVQIPSLFYDDQKSTDKPCFPDRGGGEGI